MTRPPGHRRLTEQAVEGGRRYDASVPSGPPRKPAIIQLSCGPYLKRTHVAG